MTAGKTPKINPKILPSLMKYFSDGLGETLVITQVLAMVGAIVLILYGRSGSIGEVLPASFIFANILAFCIKFLGAVFYRLFFNPFKPGKARHFFIWFFAIFFGTIIGTQLAIAVTTILLGSYYPMASYGKQPILLTGNLLMTLTLSIYAYTNIRVKKKLKQQVIKTEETKRIQIQSKLAGLQSKINPHFLFNTLSAMADLVYKEPENVEKMILNLSDIYRQVLNFPEDQKISIINEIKLVRKYLEIEKMRMGKRLEFDISVPENLESAKVPPLIIEPLVENAVIHGISKQPKGGKIWLSVNKKQEYMQINVKDNGVGMSTCKGRAGFGLYSIQERLELIYPQKSTFKIIPLPEGGVNVFMEFPDEN